MTGRPAALLALAACLMAPGCAATKGGVPPPPASAAGTPAPPSPGPSIRPERPPIVIDGDLDDWAQVGRVRFSADPETRGAALDLRAIWLADDPEGVFLRLDFRGPANVQGLPGALSLALDVDGDSSTGVDAQGLPGTDLLVDFTRRDPETGELRDGVTVRLPGEPEARLDPDDIGLMFEPRYAAPSIEVRIARGVELPGGTRTFAGAGFGARPVFRDAAGVVQDEMGPIAYELGTEERALEAAGVEGAGPRAAGPVGRHPAAAFRLVSWNVSRENLLERARPIARILAALDPDLVLLDEVPPAATEVDVRRVLPAMAATADEPAPGWRVQVGTSGGRQRAAIAVRAALRAEPSFARIPYPDSVRALLAEPPTDDLAEVRESAAGGGVPAAGGWVEIAGGRLLVATLDLVCCGNSAAAMEDRIRRIEATAVHAAARSALRAARARGTAVAGVLVGGDLNLVGSRAPLDVLTDGLDLDGSALEPLYAPQLDGRSVATWSGRGGPFPPGRLDYVLYSGSTVRPLHAFAFETDDLSPEGLARHGLRADDSALASDHLPVVGDFTWIRDADAGGIPR